MATRLFPALDLAVHRSHPPSRKGAGWDFLQQACTLHLKGVLSAVWKLLTLAIVEPSLQKSYSVTEADSEHSLLVSWMTLYLFRPKFLP